MDGERGVGILNLFTESERATLAKNNIIKKGAKKFVLFTSICPDSGQMVRD